MAVKKTTTTRKTTAKATESKAVEPIIEEVVEEKVVEKKPIAPQRKRIQVDRNTEVVIMNNTGGKVVYFDPKTQMTFEMAEYGDIEYITVDELLTMKNRARAILEKFWAVIIDVNSDEITVDDVLEYLQLKKLYETENPFDVDRLLDNAKISEFKSVVDNASLAMFERIVDRAVRRFKVGEFGDYAKVQYLQDKTKNEYLFELSKEDEE